MAKRKLKKFAELNTFNNVFQPKFSREADAYYQNGQWAYKYFNNENPLVLELGCGKGEYTNALAERFPNKNFIGIDVKGDRLWRASLTSQEKNLLNTAFLRIQIDYITNFFAPKQIDEIWITFPDPQPNKPKINKRLTSPNFLQKYKSIIKDNGIIHLKTDNKPLFDYTLEVLHELKCTVINSTDDLYSSEILNDILSVRTFYENIFSNAGFKICYVSFHF